MILTDDQVEEICGVFKDPNWYMNGAFMDTKHELYYENWRILNYLFFDLETTSLVFEDEWEKTPSREFGVIQYYGETYFNRERDEDMNFLINPLLPIHEKASKAHGLFDHDVEFAPTFDKVWPKLRHHFMDVDALVAFNGPNFDIPGLVIECVRWGTPYEEYEPLLNKPCIDYLAWERNRTKKMSGNQLSDIAKRHGVAMMGRVAHGRENLHDAKIDVKAMAELAIKMQEELPWTLGQLVEKQAGYTSLQRQYYWKTYGPGKTKKEKKK